MAQMASLPAPNLPHTHKEFVLPEQLHAATKAWIEHVNEFMKQSPVGSMVAQNECKSPVWFRSQPSTAHSFSLHCLCADRVVAVDVLESVVLEAVVKLIPNLGHFSSEVRGQTLSLLLELSEVLQPQTDSNKLIEASKRIARIDVHGKAEPDILVSYPLHRSMVHFHTCRSLAAKYVPTEQMHGCRCLVFSHLHWRRRRRVPVLSQYVLCTAIKASQLS